MALPEITEEFLNLRNKLYSRPVADQISAIEDAAVRDQVVLARSNIRNFADQLVNRDLDAHRVNLEMLEPQIKDGITAVHQAAEQLDQAAKALEFAAALASLAATVAAAVA